MTFDWLKDAIRKVYMTIHSDSAVRVFTKEELAELRKIEGRLREIHNFASIRNIRK